MLTGACIGFGVGTDRIADVMLSYIERPPRPHLADADIRGSP